LDSWPHLHETSESEITKQGEVFAGVQLHHLSEIKRVLKADGIAYLAAPNRWAIWEHHYDIPFQAWLPLPVASWLVRITGKGTCYDCRPLSRSDLIGLFSATDIVFEDITIEALRYFAEEEMNPAMRKLVGICADYFFCLLRPFVPTHVFLGRKQ
jgi:SAM-dependent methyltransferase